MGYYFCGKLSRNTRRVRHSIAGAGKIEELLQYASMDYQHATEGVIKVARSASGGSIPFSWNKLALLLSVLGDYNQLNNLSDDVIRRGLSYQILRRNAEPPPTRTPLPTWDEVELQPLNDKEDEHFVAIVNDVMLYDKIIQCIDSGFSYTNTFSNLARHFQAFLCRVGFKRPSHKQQFGKLYCHIAEHHDRLSDLDPSFIGKGLRSDWLTIKKEEPPMAIPPPGYIHDDMKDAFSCPIEVTRLTPTGTWFFCKAKESSKLAEEQFNWKIDQERMLSEIAEHMNNAEEHFAKVTEALPQPKEETPMKFTTVNYINGNDQSTLSDDAIIELIRKEQAALAALEVLEITHSSSIDNKIATHKDNIDKLVALLDSHVE